MSLSLREQLLAAGLGTKKQAKKAEHEEGRRKERERKAPPQADPRKVAADRAQAAKVARDQELNKQRQAEAERRARVAEIKQLIEQHRVPKVESDDYYNFIGGKKIRRIAVNPDLRAAILKGDLVVVRCEGHNDIVPREIADRIREREPRMVIAITDSTTQSPDENDPYKDHVVPDDLMW
jgi:uncharacterized protein YaiL (DUF2058 family)